MFRPLLIYVLTATLAVPGALFAKSEDAPQMKPKEDVSQIGDRDVDGKVNFYSISKEIALGKQLADDVERNAKIVDDPIVSEYVNRVGQNIVRNSDAKVPFTIKVIDSDEVNAFALPGGYFFVNTGLIALAEDEAELAGVMAHEIAHVTARHGTRQATRGQIANYATLPLMFLGGWAGYAIRQAAGLAIPMTFLKFSRGFEKEADFLGVQYLYASGYDPSEMVEFFERLQSQEKRKPGKLSAAFRSHPPTGARIGNVQESIEELLPGKDEYLITSSEFTVVKDRLALIQRAGRKRTEETDPNRPTLRRPGSGGKIEPGDGGSGDVEDIEDEDQPPVLRRGTLTQAPGTTGGL